MSSFNKAILMGRLTADPELKQTQNGTQVTSFTLAVDRRFGQGENKQTDFISVIAWRSTAEFISRYFRKGNAMIVCGEIQTRSWTDQQGQKRYATEVVANEVSFCESKKASEGNNTTSNQFVPQNQKSASLAYVPDAYTPNFEAVQNDEDLPF